MSARHIRPGPSPARGRTTPTLLGWTLIAASAVIMVATVALTAQGRQIAGAVQGFLLYYAGVFALLALTAAVVMGLAVTDRMVMTPTSRVVGQAAHRILSLAAVAALLTHIALETIAHRTAVTDALVPFLSHNRTFYIGLGTLASDLMLLVVVTSIWRGRFTGRPHIWRAIHVTAYLAWLMSIVHGLLGGRAAKPYVDWSYGACFAAVTVALAVRMMAAHRGRGHYQPLPVPDRLASTAPLQAGILLDSQHSAALPPMPRHRPRPIGGPMGRPRPPVAPDDEYPPWR